MNVKNEELKKMFQLHAIGDSICLPYEFLKKTKIDKRIKKYGLMQTLIPYKNGIGVTSDDTDHFILTLKALINYQSPEQFQKKLAWYLRFWFFTLPPGIGLSTLKSIIKLWLFIPLKYAGVKSSGNGPLMRMPIISMILANNKNRLDYLNMSTELTHKGLEINTITNQMSNLFVEIYKNKKLPEKEKLKNIFILNNEKELNNWNETLKIFFDSKDENLSDFLNKIKCEKGVSGYAVHTAIFIMYVLYNTKSIEEAFNMVIEVGGDTDTIGAILGSYLSLIYTLDVENLKKWNHLINLNLENDISIHIKEKNIWLIQMNILIKNLISTPIILLHGFIRLFY